jgi:hypothetical protein
MALENQGFSRQVPVDMSAGEPILYTTEDGEASIQLRVEDGTVWLTQLELAELFQTSKQYMSLYVKNVLSDGELSGDSIVKYSLTTESDGKSYPTKT